MKIKMKAGTILFLVVLAVGFSISLVHGEYEVAFWQFMTTLYMLLFSFQVGLTNFWKIEMGKKLDENIIDLRKLLDEFSELKKIADSLKENGKK